MSVLTRAGGRQAVAPVFWIALALAMVMTILPVLLAPHDMWDGAAIHYMLASADHPGLKEALLDGDFHITYALVIAVRSISELASISVLTGLRCVSLLGLLLVARETYWLALDWFDLSRSMAIFSAALLLVLPCWSMLFTSVALITVYVGFGLLGHRLLLRRGKVDVALGYLLVALSFQLNSNFVFLALLHVLAWRHPRLRASCSIQKTLFLGLLVIGGYSVRLVLPTQGIHAADYNSILIPTSFGVVFRQLLVVASFATWAIFPLIAALAAYFYCRSQGSNPRQNSRPGGPEINQPSLSNREVASYLLILCLASIGAYVAVGKGDSLLVVASAQSSIVTSRALADFGGWPLRDSLFEWKTRYIAILAVPLALGSAWFVSLGLRDAGELRSARFQRLVVLVWLFSAIWLGEAYYEKYQRLADDLRLIGYFRSNPPQPGMVDIEVFPVRPYLMRDSEANYLLWVATGRTQWAAAVYTPGTNWAAVTRADREQFFGKSPLPGKGELANRIATDYARTGCRSVYSFHLQSPGLADVLNTLWRNPLSATAPSVQSVKISC